MTEKEIKEFIKNGKVESIGTMGLQDFIKSIVVSEFYSLRNEMEKNFNKTINKMRKDFDEVNKSNIWRSTHTERHAILVEEYMANMNEILEKRL